MKVIYSGLESSGKSLMLARKAEALLYRNAKWHEKSGVARPIYSNMAFSANFLERAEIAGIPIRHWENLEEVVGLNGIDLIIDEIGTYFDARTWTDLSLTTRRWIQQAAKLGVEIYGAAQDFAQVDISFRRLVNELWYIKKLIGSRRPSNTRPPVKTIWGVCMLRELDPRDYREADNEFKSAAFLPSFFLIRRHDCEIFDTTQLIKKGRLPPLLHETRICPDCGFEKISHK